MKHASTLVLGTFFAATVLADSAHPNGSVTPGTQFESSVAAEFKAAVGTPIGKGSIEVVPLGSQPWYTAPDHAVARQIVSPSNSRCTTLSLAEIIIPAGVAVREHFHKQREEIYHIVAGKGLMTLDGKTAEVGPGDTVVVHIGEHHKIQAHRDADLEMIVASVPAWSEADLNFTE